MLPATLGPNWILTSVNTMLSLVAMLPVTASGHRGNLGKKE